MGLDRLIIKNFKSIGEPGVDLELRPLTLLVGPNGGGKSSILEALAIFAQSIGRDNLQTWGDLIKAGPSQGEAIPTEEFLHSKSSSLELVFYKDNLEYRYIYQHLGVSYEDPVLKKPLRVALASHGSRQILTVIVNLLWCQPGSIFLIEEPEISLHPEAQVKMCELFAEVIAQEKQIIATTHSHFLLSALGIPVQEGRLRPEDIAVYHVEKKPDSGTIAEQLPLNEKGYIEGWIPSFADVEKRLLREWVKTIPED